MRRGSETIVDIDVDPPNPNSKWSQVKRKLISNALKRANLKRDKQNYHLRKRKTLPGNKPGSQEELDTNRNSEPKSIPTCNRVHTQKTNYPFGVIIPLLAILLVIATLAVVLFKISDSSLLRLEPEQKSAINCLKFIFVCLLILVLIALICVSTSFQLSTQSLPDILLILKLVVAAVITPIVLFCSLTFAAVITTASLIFAAGITVFTLTVTFFSLLMGWGFHF